jgi:hypothetical protein
VSSTALCTTVHTSVLPYVQPFLTSIAAQSDTDSDVWIVLDGIDAGLVRAAAPPGLILRFVRAREGSTPAEVRTTLFDEIGDSYELAVLVDADDLLEPSRVASAKASIREADVSACAMWLIDHSGGDLGRPFAALPDGSPAALDGLLPRGNVFGLSNSCYRMATLTACLPVPASCVAVDWYLVTAARLRGARLAFDDGRHMRYRQHEGNIAPVVPPFSPDSIARATGVVQRHHEVVAGLGGDVAMRAALRGAREALEVFVAAIAEPGLLERYVRALNELPSPQAWWTMVASSELEAVWRP